MLYSCGIQVWQRERERDGVFHKEAKMSVDLTAAYKDTTKEMYKSENAEVKDSCLPNNVFVKICDQRTPPGDTKSTQKPEFDLFSLCFQSHNLFWIVLRPTSPSQSMLTHTASWRWQHATTRSWIWRRSVWETISFRQSRLWRAGRRHIDRGSEASKNRYFKSTCECFLCDYRYCFFVFFYFIWGFFAVAGAQRAARSGDEKTTGLFQSDASARRVVRVRACSSASVGCFPTALRFNLHLHTEKPTPAFTPTSHMCTQDYINPKENSTTTNKERFVYKWTGCAKLF